MRRGICCVFLASSLAACAAVDPPLGPGGGELTASRDLVDAGADADADGDAGAGADADDEPVSGCCRVTYPEPAPETICLDEETNAERCGLIDDGDDGQYCGGQLLSMFRQYNPLFFVVESEEACTGYEAGSSCDGQPPLSRVFHEDPGSDDCDGAHQPTPTPDKWGCCRIAFDDDSECEEVIVHVGSEAACNGYDVSDRCDGEEPASRGYVADHETCVELGAEMVEPPLPEGDACTFLASTSPDEGCHPPGHVELGVAGPSAALAACQQMLEDEVDCNGVVRFGGHRGGYGAGVGELFHCDSDASGSFEWIPEEGTALFDDLVACLRLLLGDGGTFVLDSCNNHEDVDCLQAMADLLGATVVAAGDYCYCDTCCFSESTTWLTVTPR